MSILHTFENGWLISHENYINKVYVDVQYMETKLSYQIDNGLFNIIKPFKKLKDESRKRKREHHHLQKCHTDLDAVRDLVQQIHNKVKQEIEHLLEQRFVINSNSNPLEISSRIYDDSGRIPVQDVIGANTDGAKFVTINDQNYLFPENCKFYCKNVVEIESYLRNIKYDLIVLDPPWWNKYIRRKKVKTNHGYSMMYNHDLKNIPIENLLNDNGVVVVWCTNSRQNLDDLKDIFTKWNIHLTSRWFWLKVTLKGDPICSFSEPPGKQPFEQIVIGVRNTEFIGKIPNQKVIFSVPSALHSHKPPLIELLQDLLPPAPNCLELFARYLLPNWTSWGLEAIRFQHESLFEVSVS